MAAATITSCRRPPRRPAGRRRTGSRSNSFGVRVPAVIVSPYVRPGTILRPAGSTPFDHTSIIATLRRLFGFAPLTPRDAAAPDLLGAFADEPSNDGPASVEAHPVEPAAAQVTVMADKPPNDMQRSLYSAAVQLPTAGADIAAHVRRIADVADPVSTHPTVAATAADVVAHMRAFLGR